jgi:hypothetical protein
VAVGRCGSHHGQQQASTTDDDAFADVRWQGQTQRGNSVRFLHNGNKRESKVTVRLI